MNESQVKTMPSEQKKEQISKSGQILTHHQLTEHDMNENSVQMKLNIVRTIEIMDNKILQANKTGLSKKVEKVQKKPTKPVEIKTTTLFLRYNKIKSIEGFKDVLPTILPNWHQLIWIDLSHNRITTLVTDFQSLTQLKNLYLHANFINNFKEFEKLIGVKLLRTFTIHGNPIQNYPEFRVLLSCILPQLQKIDSTLLTKRQRQRGEVLTKQGNKKYPLITNPQKPPQQSEDEEQN